MLSVPSGAKAAPADANKHTHIHTLRGLRACTGLNASQNVHCLVQWITCES